MFSATSGVALLNQRFLKESVILNLQEQTKTSRQRSCVWSNIVYTNWFCFTSMLPPAVQLIHTYIKSCIQSFDKCKQSRELPRVFSKQIKNSTMRTNAYVICLQQSTHIPLRRLTSALDRMQCQAEDGNWVQQLDNNFTVIMPDLNLFQIVFCRYFSGIARFFFFLWRFCFSYFSYHFR